MYLFYTQERLIIRYYLSNTQISWKWKHGFCPSTTPSQTVSVLEERLTLTEDKLKECLQHQSQIIKEMGQSRARRRTGAEGSPVRLTWRHASRNNCSKEKRTLAHSMACMCVCALGWVYFASHYKVFALLHNTMVFYPTGAVLTQMNKWCCTIKTVLHLCTGKTKVKGHVLWWPIGK